MARVTEEHIEARRRSILEAAAQVFGDCGIASATMAGIASAAGISAGAIYRYFPSKQELVAACFREGAAQVADIWTQHAAQAADPKSAFYAVAAQSFEQLGDPGAESITRMMLENFLDATRSPQPGELELVASEHGHVIRGLANMLAAVRVKGQLPADLNTDCLAEALWCFWMGARIGRLIMPGFDTDGQLAAVSALMNAAEPTAQPA